MHQNCMYLISFSYSIHIQLMLQNAIMLWWISCETDTITPFNSFWSNYTIWWQRSGSTLAYMVATNLVKKNFLTFPWHLPGCQVKFQSLSRHISSWFFSQNIFITTSKSCYSLIIIIIHHGVVEDSTRVYFQHYENHGILEQISCETWNRI